ncbi:MAG: hypothetical protein JSV76_04640 [Candidatus Bathyarchaeota archaeon]|nr:MAG: hypothetical protein JSV76_04640 [Candidatus Bathyarchaeota archaeon]
MNSTTAIKGEGEYSISIPEYVATVAWDEAAGECERCGTPLAWRNRGKKTMQGGWMLHYMAGGDIRGRRTTANYEILCSKCYMKIPV